MTQLLILVSMWCGQQGNVSNVSIQECRVKALRCVDKYYKGEDRNPRFLGDEPNYLIGKCIRNIK